MNIALDIFDLLIGKKKIKIVKNRVYEWEKQTKKNLKKLRNKVKQGEKIKVAFLIMFATSTQDFGIFEMMLKSDLFDPYIIANPDVSRSRENFEINYNKTVKEMTEKYGVDRVLKGYDYETDSYTDYTSDFDMMFTNNPYDNMANKYFKIKYWTEKNIPICYISYFYMGRCKITTWNLKRPEASMFWKFFVENNYVKKLAKKHQKIEGANVVVTGYPKLDGLAKIKKEEHSRKRIILAPHHSINTDLFASFFDYCDTLLKLPEKYPDIDFIFRPHPLLIQNLKKEEFWGEAKTEEYLNKLLNHKNITYSTEGDYFDLFINSDGMFHDCGSFMAEYLCTDHPCAFFLGKDVDVENTFLEFGIKCLEQHYICKREEDIYNFIDNVIIKGDDPKKEERNRFAKEEIMINYPNATKCIYENIVKELK